MKSSSTRLRAVRSRRNSSRAAASSWRGHKACYSTPREITTCYTTCVMGGGGGGGHGVLQHTVVLIIHTTHQPPTHIAPYSIITPSPAWRRAVATAAGAPRRLRRQRLPRAPRRLPRAPQRQRLPQAPPAAAASMPTMGGPRAVAARGRGSARRPPPRGMPPPLAEAAAAAPPCRRHVLNGRGMCQRCANDRARARTSGGSGKATESYVAHGGDAEFVIGTDANPTQ